MKSPEQVLKEIRQLQEKLPAALQQKVGNVFLGGVPGLAKAQKAKAEPDTPWEDEVYIQITDWLNTSSDPVATYFKKNKALFDQLAKELHGETNNDQNNNDDDPFAEGNYIRRA